MARPVILALVLAAVASVVARAGQGPPPLEQSAPPAPAPGQPAASKNWTVDELLPAIVDLGRGRDWMRGGQVFQQAGCGVCHAFSTYWEGNGLAPDLTAVASKLTRDIILESILEPSAALNGQYYHTEFRLKDGTIVSGSVIEVENGTIRLAPVMMTPDVTIAIAESEVVSERPSKVSPMPPGLLNGFTREQILDLIAFLDAGGDPDAAIYKK